MLYYNQHDIFWTLCVSFLKMQCFGNCICLCPQVNHWRGKNPTQFGSLEKVILSSWTWDWSLVQGLRIAPSNRPQKSRIISSIVSLEDGNRFISQNFMFEKLKMNSARMQVLSLIRQSLYIILINMRTYFVIFCTTKGYKIKAWDSENMGNFFY
jgi:hypothetical protein